MDNAHYLKNAGLSLKKMKDIGSKGAEKLGEAYFKCPRKCNPSSRVGIEWREEPAKVSDIET